MSNIEVVNYIEDWLEGRKIKSFFKDKKKGKEKYIRIKEKDFYEFCYKLVDLIKDNIE